MITSESSLEDVAFDVCTALAQANITAVLTGGSAATVYAPEAYQSRDCDFVLTLYDPNSNGKKVMEDLGFKTVGGTYKHPITPYTVEFPAGPLSVGETIISKWATLARGNQLLHILTPTDCCRDRLAGFYHWNDFSSAQQAVAVAKLNPVDLNLIEEWSIKEGAVHKFQIFCRMLETS